MLEENRSDVSSECRDRAAGETRRMGQYDRDDAHSRERRTDPIVSSDPKPIAVTGELTELVRDRARSL